MLELQTAYVSSLGHLQTPGEDHIPSLMRRIRISRFKCCSLTSDNEKINFSGYLSNIKLQTAYVSSLGHLQTPGEVHIPSLMRRIRISRLKCCSLTSDSEKIDFSGYLISSL